MAVETTDNYIPQAGDKVTWMPVRKIQGRIIGQVDYIITNEQIALVFIPPSKTQASESRGINRTRYRKRFDQLTLLERPEV